MTKWSEPLAPRGILIAADETLEWLLPWWWARYLAHNSLPVAVVDLGLSHFGRQYCLKRGKLIELDVTSTFESTQETAHHWESIFGKRLWKNRNEWFKKPFACLKTPFEKTLWLDVDCEVLAPLDELFETDGLSIALETEASIAKERERGCLGESEKLYNSGVILFEHKEPLIEKWAIAVVEEGEQFWSDQHVLSRIIERDHAPLSILDPRYNWRMSQGVNFQAKIVHWVGSWGKDYIRQHGGLGEALTQLVGISP